MGPQSVYDGRVNRFISQTLVNATFSAWFSESGPDVVLGAIPQDRNRPGFASEIYELAPSSISQVVVVLVQ